MRDLVIVALAGAVACAPAVKRLGAAPTPTQMAELWIDPGSTARDLFLGPGGTRYKHPPTDAPYDIDSVDTAGFMRWICQRLQRITDRQWHDASRAGNYTSDVTARYLARVRPKIDEGLRLH